MKSFNINNTVKVKINRQGIEQWVRYYTSLGCDEKEIREHTVMPHIDKDGYAEIELHQLANIFGPHLYQGNNGKDNTNPFDSMNILIDEKDLTDVRGQCAKKLTKPITGIQDVDMRIR